VDVVPVEAYKVEGNEGLLDTNRMERAFKGTGIKIPPGKQLKVGIIGAGLAGLITAMELSEAGHSVEIFDSRRFPGGKVGSWVDKDGNHIEMGLHVLNMTRSKTGIARRLLVEAASVTAPAPP
jgi:zeta-carotene desaturase